MGRYNGNIAKVKKEIKRLTLIQLKNWGLKYHKIYFGKAVEKTFNNALSATSSVNEKLTINAISTYRHSGMSCLALKLDMERVNSLPHDQCSLSDTLVPCPTSQIEMIYIFCLFLVQRQNGQ